jgi:alpha-tubulin suppressor-like RCC1 family protein
MRHFAIASICCLTLLACGESQTNRAPEGGVPCAVDQIKDGVTGRCVSELGESSTCPNDNFDMEHPWLAGSETLFVAVGGSGPGGEKDPLGDLTAAVAALPNGGVIALGKGIYNTPDQLPGTITLVGNCATQTLLEGRLNVSGEQVRIAGLTLGGGLKASGVKTLALHQVRVVAPEASGLQLIQVGTLALSRSSFGAIADSAIALEGDTLEVGINGVDFLGPIGHDGISIGSLGGIHHSWTLTSNRFSDIAGSALNAPDLGVVTPLADLQVTGNNFLGPIGHDGISIGNLGGTHWLIESNQFASLAGSALRLTGTLTDLSISKNNFLGPIGTDGISLGPIGMDGVSKIDGNTFTNVGARAIDLVEASGTMEVAGNTISDSGWPAISASDIGATGTLAISDNALTGVDQLGITIEGTVGPVTLENNTITDVGVPEIGGSDAPPAMGFAILVVDSSDVTARGNTLERNEVGIVIDASGWAQTYDRDDLSGPLGVCLENNTFVDQGRRMSGSPADVVLQALPADAELNGNDIQRSVSEESGQPVAFRRNGRHPSYRGSLALGASHLCGISAQRNLVCCGANHEGQSLPSNRDLSFLEEGEATDVSGIAILAAGNKHTCVLRQSRAAHEGDVICSGSNTVGQLGTELVEQDRLSPVQTVRGQVLTGAAKIAAGQNTTCIVHKSGAVYCWGDPEEAIVSSRYGTKSAQEIPGISNARAIAVGGRHACAIAGEEVLCWGDKSCGQLGDGYSSLEACNSNTTHAVGPNPVAGLPAKPTGLALGTAHSCVLTETGAVYCFGDNRHKQLGLPNGGFIQDTPTEAVVFPGDPAIKQIAAGSHHTCGLTRRAGLVLCWGAGNHQQIGGAAVDRAEPAPIDTNDLTASALTKVVSLSLHEDTSCARQASGSTYCWGTHTYLESTPDTATAEHVGAL